MSATLFLIDKIEGNSNIGVPVFSRLGIKQNYEYLAFAPQKKIKSHNDNKQKEALNQDFNRFRVAGSSPTNAVKSKAPQFDFFAGGFSPKSPESLANDLQNQELVLKVMGDMQQRISQYDQGSSQNQQGISNVGGSQTTKQSRNQSRKARRSMMQTAPFVSTTRDEYFEAHFKGDSGNIPPTGAYRAKFDLIDKRTLTLTQYNTMRSSRKTNVEPNQQTTNKFQFCEVKTICSMMNSDRTTNMSKKFQSPRSIFGNKTSMGTQKQEKSIEKNNQLLSSRSAVGFSSTVSREKAMEPTAGAHEARFTLADNFDKSKYLTTSRNPQLVLSFNKYTQRREDELWRAGNSAMILKDRNLQDYDSSKKEAFFNRDLTGGVPQIGKICGRENANHNSIYTKVLAPDSTNNVAVAEACIKNLKPKPRTLIDLKRSSKRDFSISLKTTEAYKNIERDNQRAQALKHLMISS